MDGVVCKMKSIGKLAAQAGIIPTSDRTKGESLPNFDKMLQGFQIETTGIWRHNGANNPVYQLTLVFIIALFPILFPTASGGYPSDPTITGLSVNEIWAKLAQGKETMAPLSSGSSQFCFYCDTADDHDAEECPNKTSIVCELCKNTVGPKDKKYRDRQIGHHKDRCTFQYKHRARKFPPWLEQLNLDLEAKRTLPRGMALEDFEMIGKVYYKSILKKGPMGNDELQALWQMRR